MSHPASTKANGASKMDSYQRDVDDDGPVHVEEDLSEEHEDEGSGDRVRGRGGQGREDERSRDEQPEAADH